MKYFSSVSNILILLSAIATGIAFFIPESYVLWINHYFIDLQMYYMFVLQCFTGMFLHWGIIHLLSNAIFIYIFGNILEMMIGKTKYILFFIFIAFFNGFLLLAFSTGNTIGISGFCMALLSYYTLELYFQNNIEYKGGFTAIIANLAIGILPWISLLGHFFWALWGIIFYFLTREYLRKKMIGVEFFEKI